MSVKSAHRLLATLVFGFFVFAASPARADDDPEPVAHKQAEPEHPKGDDTDSAKPEADHSAKAAEQPKAAAAEVDPVSPAEQAAADEAAVESGAPTGAEMHEHEAIAEKDPKKYAAMLHDILGKVRVKVLDKVEKKILAAHEKKMDQLSFWFFMFSLSGLLLLFVPLFLMKKYPGKLGVLFKYSAISSLATVVVLNLFAGVMLLLKSAQGLLGTMTNPQIKIIEASFDILSKQVEDLVLFGPQLIEPTLGQLNGHADQSMVELLLENVKRLGKDATPFINIAKAFKSLTWVLEYVPMVLMAVSILMFALAAKAVLVELIRLPARAAAGEAGVGREVMKKAFGMVWREFLAALCLIACLVAVTMISSVALTQALAEAVDAFLSYFFVCVLYVLMAKDAAGSLIMTSLGGTLLFLALNVAVIVVSSSFFLGKAHKIFQQKFQHRVPLGAHRKFWVWGTLSMLFLQLFPVLFAAGALPLVKIVIEKTFDPQHPNWTLTLASGPALMVGLFVIVFFAAQGFRALKFLKKYDVKTLPGTVVAPEPTDYAQAQAQGQAQGHAHAHEQHSADVVQGYAAYIAPPPSTMPGLDPEPQAKIDEAALRLPASNPNAEHARAAAAVVPALISTNAFSSPAEPMPMPLVRRDISADATTRMDVGSALDLPLLNPDGMMQPLATATARPPSTPPRPAPAAGRPIAATTRASTPPVPVRAATPSSPPRPATPSSPPRPATASSPPRATTPSSPPRPTASVSLPRPASISSDSPITEQVVAIPTSPAVVGTPRPAAVTASLSAVASASAAASAGLSKPVPTATRGTLRPPAVKAAQVAGGEPVVYRRPNVAAPDYPPELDQPAKGHPVASFARPRSEPPAAPPVESPRPARRTPLDP